MFGSLSAEAAHAALHWSPQGVELTLTLRHGQWHTQWTFACARTALPPAPAAICLAPRLRRCQRRGAPASSTRPFALLWDTQLPPPVWPGAPVCVGACELVPAALPAAVAAVVLDYVGPPECDPDAALLVFARPAACDGQHEPCAAAATAHAPPPPPPCAEHTPASVCEHGHPRPAAATQARVLLAQYGWLLHAPVAPAVLRVAGAASDTCTCLPVGAVACSATMVPRADATRIMADELTALAPWLL